MAACAPFSPGDPYVRGVVSYIDCHSVSLAEQGYRALGAGSQFATAVDGLLVIAVAVVGYTMLLGGRFAIRDAVLVVLRIGLVLTLALHWSAYQPLVYDVATRGPQQLLSSLFAGSDIGANNRDGLVERVQGVDSVIGAMLHPEREIGTQSPAVISNGSVASQPSQNTGQNSFGQTSELAPDVREFLGSADNMVIVSALAGFVSLRIVMALLLALGPIFIAALLFDTARNLFAGWLRVLIGAMLGSVAVPTVVAMELALLEPQVVTLRGLFESGRALGSLPEQLWITSSLFALVMLGTLVAVALAASAIRFPVHLHREILRMFEGRHSQIPTVRAAPPVASAPPQPFPERSHAQRTADAVLKVEQRDFAAGSSIQMVRAIGPRSDVTDRRATMSEPGRIGQAGRNSGRRLSATANRRDQE